MLTDSVSTVAINGKEYIFSNQSPVGDVCFSSCFEQREEFVFLVLNFYAVILVLL